MPVAVMVEVPLAPGATVTALPASVYEPASAPEPVMFTVCGEFGALSVEVSVAVRVPVIVGVKVTVVTQEAPIARVPQGLDAI